MPDASPPSPAQERLSHESRLRALSLLCSVLPSLEGSFRAALEHSRSAFELLDRWKGYGCVDALRRGVPREFASDPGARDDEFILAPCLTAPIDGQRFTGIPILKALLLVGVAEGRREEQVMATLASGVFKARRSGSWSQIMPRALPLDATIPDALAHCGAHAVALLKAPGERAKLETEWLQALARWCELLQQTRRAAAIRPRNAGFGQEIEIDDGDADARPLPTYIDIYSGQDAPSTSDDDQDEVEPLPPSQSPEAPPSKPRAQAASEDEPESVDGGEARRARAGFRSALENQLLPWTNRQLNPVDTAALVPAMKASLAPGQAARDAVGVLAWAHVTGQLVEQSLEIGRVPLADGSYLQGRTYMRFVAPQENAWEPTPEQAPLMRPHASHVPLVLPFDVADWLDEKFPKGHPGPLRNALRVSPQAAMAEIRAWLTELRQSTGGQQTLGRVTWWLPIALYQVRADHVPPHLLCAINDGLPCPSAYYRSYEINKLSDLHRETLSRAGWSLPPASDSTLEPVTGWVGSRLNPEPEHVKHIWDRVTRHFESQVADKSSPLFKRHNARELHETLSQMFQTFHRTVSDPLESLEYIDMDVRRMLVDDKSQGDARAHRLIPLTALAARQCGEQIDHVRRLSVAIASEAPETAQRLLASIDHPEWRAAPFRFLLSEQLEIIRLKPKALMAALAGLWDLPLNLGRHFGSTWLLGYRGQDGRLISDDALCSLLGHHDLGTQNLSLLSPVDFETLFETLTPALDDLVCELGLRSIPSFLPPVAATAALGRSRKRPSPMVFGHERREQARARQRAGLLAEAEQRIRDRLRDKALGRLSQEDVDALFEEVRKATPNRRNFWASERFEAMRTAIVEVMGRFEEMKLELPSIALAIKDAAHICSMDGLAAARWLRDLRSALAEERVKSFRAWRTTKGPADSTPPAMAVLCLVVDSLIIDPAAWSAWHTGTRGLDVFMDEDDRAWIRMPLPTKNSRLYPLRRDLAEQLACIPVEDWTGFEFEAVSGLARALVAPSYGQRDTLDFWQLLNRIQSASAARMSGITLGYADGSHGSVSPERMCLERRTGLPPTVKAVAAWEAARPSSATIEMDLPSAAVLSLKERGSLTNVAMFRRRMSKALRKMDRTPAAPRNKSGAKVSQRRQEGLTTEVSSGDSKGAAEAAGTRPTSEVEMPTPKPGRAPSPMARFVDALEEQWSDLVESPQLPPACGFAAAWVHRMAKQGQSANEAYAPKTIRNYWYSWAVRFIEEFGPINPQHVTPSECEEIYLQIVEDAALTNRQHLYAPMRNFHRFLALHCGVPEIEWSQLRAATGQGLTYVDANLVHEHEYLKALDLLRKDVAVSERVRVMQAAVLVLLFRFGLRIAECLGLQSRDVSYDAAAKRWIVRVRGNQYRSLKTFNARRTVVGLENLIEAEEEILKAWSAHVETFATGIDIRPLFAAAGAGAQRAELFPRRVIAFRIGQALRATTGDPSTRVHHCRHSYATRILLTGLGQVANSVTEEDARKTQTELMQRLTEVLTGELQATRRLIWAIAVQLGHGSPLTTLETYGHGGHLILQQWCRDVLWTPVAEVDEAEWMTWSTGTALRTMQRDFQRKTLTKSDERLARVLTQWSRLPQLGEGRRAVLVTSLPSLRLVEDQSALISADLIIDHARRFGRIDGLAERLFVSEAWVESVLLAARAFSSRHRTQFMHDEQWWIEPKDVAYPEHEITAIERALESLQALVPEELAKHCQVVAPSFVPSARMVVVEADDTLTSAVTLAKTLVDDPEVIQLLVPAKLPKRLTPAERELRDSLARRKAEQRGVPFRPEKPRLVHEHGIEFEGSERALRLATKLGLSTAVHGRTAGAREGPHDWRRAGARLAVRIKENGYDRVRSAKVFARVLASAIVSCAAMDLLKEAPLKGVERQ